MPLILPRETESEIESWRSNHALSDQTERRICALIDQATADMDLLLCEVSEPRKSLVDLEQRVEKDTARIKDLRAVIAGSRFKRLPPRDHDRDIHALLQFDSLYSTETRLIPMDIRPCVRLLETDPLELDFHLE